MANIIDYTRFTVDKNLSSTEIQALITSFIVKFEPEILKKILGYDLKKAFINGLNEVTPAAKWTNLRDGVDYVVNGVYSEYQGVKDIIAYYVFYMISKEHWHISTSIGIKALKSENSISIDPAQKQCYVYNRMVDLISGLNDYVLYQNSVDNTNYPNYYPEAIGKINYFGI
jgi:hypothetical protein